MSGALVLTRRLAVAALVRPRLLVSGAVADFHNCSKLIYPKKFFVRNSADSSLSQTKGIFLVRSISLSGIKCSDSGIIKDGENESKEEGIAAEEPEGVAEPVEEKVTVPVEISTGRFRATRKDRKEPATFDTSIRYLKSDAYRETYGDNLVWTLYRRNFKGQFQPKFTRKTCIRHGVLATGNPCPICRDEYLVLDYRNVELLKQFISPFNGEILGFGKTGLCQKRQLQLLVEIRKAKDCGTITYDVPFREYDYSEYEYLYKTYKSEL